MSNCKSCKAPIQWVETPQGNITPVNPDGSPHWATCPDAEKFRKYAKKKGVSFDAH